MSWFSLQAQKAAPKPRTGPAGRVAVDPALQGGAGSGAPRAQPDFTLADVILDRKVQLGKGNSSVVHPGILKGDKTPVAVKMMKTPKDDKERDLWRPLFRRVSLACTQQCLAVPLLKRIAGVGCPWTLVHV
jgi:hypothetical protein